MVKVLDRKLLRDLWRLKGQALAIAVVIGAGVALFVLMISTFQSLDQTQRVYYQEQRFADVFASLKRAPLHLEKQLQQIPGVAVAETRVVVPVTIDVPDFEEPVNGRMISIPQPRRPMLNDMRLEEGRYPDANAANEVIVSKGFARAHRLRPGDSVAAVIAGRRRDLQITGLALSPEFIYTIRPGEMMPDDTRFGVFWMGRDELSAAFDMEGAFNDLSLALMFGASSEEVIRQVDDLLDGYGGLGAVPRSLQASHFFLQSELDGLRNIGSFLPMVFLAVAAFLLNIVLTRTVALQRTQIAAIKALGHSNLTIAMHYIKWALLVGLLGSILGIGVGIYLGNGMTSMYTAFFHFPILIFVLDPRLIVAGVAICFVAATLGALNAVRTAVKLPPAEAMRPAPPSSYRKTLVERLGIGHLLSQPARMILRNIQRQPGRTFVSVIGIASGAAMMVAGNFSFDSMDRLMEMQFDLQQRFDMSVSFTEPLSRRALHDLRGYDGILQAEPFRAVPVRLRHDNQSRYGSIMGVREDNQLQRVIDASGHGARISPEGLMLSAQLAKVLDVQAGEVVHVEVLEGARPRWDLKVDSVVEEYMGMNVYLQESTLHRLLGESETLSGAYLRTDPAKATDLYKELKKTPAIAGIALKSAAIASVEDTLDEMITKIRVVNVLFAALITLGVVYNAARVSLSERSRELASLRVIGFRRAEISYILLGELALVTLLAVPVGLLLGYGLAAWTVQAYETEVYRLPFVISNRTYAYAAITVMVSATLSGFAVRRKLDRLDLIEVLKSRE